MHNFLNKFVMKIMQNKIIKGKSHLVLDDVILYSRQL